MLTNPNLRQWLESYIQAYKKVLRTVRVGLAVCAITIVGSLMVPNRYKSESKILPTDARGAGGIGAAAAAAAGISLPGTDGPDAIYIDILNSRSLRKELLSTQFTYSFQSWYFGHRQFKTKSLYEYLNKKNSDRALNSLKGFIVVTRESKTKILTISVETVSPELSQQIIQRMTGLLNEFVVTKAQTRGHIRATFSERRLVEARKELAQAEEELRSFLDGNRNFLLSPDPSVRLKGMRLDNELKLRTQVLSTLAIGREQALLEEKNDMAILNLLDEANLPIEKSGPSRGVWVVVSTVLAILGAFGWERREWLLSKFMGTEA